MKEQGRRATKRRKVDYGQDRRETGKHKAVVGMGVLAEGSSTRHVEASLQVEVTQAARSSWVNQL